MFHSLLRHLIYHKQKCDVELQLEYECAMSVHLTLAFDKQYMLKPSPT